MSISYTYNKNAHFVHTEVTDVITLPEVLAYVDKLLVDDNISSPFYEIVDFKNIQSFDFGYYQADELYNKLALLTEAKQHMGTCFIAHNEITAGMANIFSIVGKDKNMNIQIFKTLDQALKYVEENTA